MIEAYPLQWPIGYPRTAMYAIKGSNFSEKTLAYVTNLLMSEIKRMGGKNVILSCNIPLNKNGYPRSDYARRLITDKGAAVYFIYNGRQVVLACDKWNRIEDNIYAMSLSIEAMRGLSRWGVSQVLERTFSGFTALPEAKHKRSPWDVLGMQPNRDEKAIHNRYRELSLKMHPDTGGTTESFVELQEARDAAVKFARGL